MNTPLMCAGFLGLGLVLWGIHDVLCTILAELREINAKTRKLS